VPRKEKAVTFTGSVVVGTVALGAVHGAPVTELMGVSVSTSCLVREKAHVDSVGVPPPQDELAGAVTPGTQMARYQAVADMLLAEAGTVKVAFSVEKGVASASQNMNSYSEG
jgi:hypothetical protein